MTIQDDLAQYKGQVDAKYANVRKVQEEHERRERERMEFAKRKDHWLLIDPNGRIDGVRAHWSCDSELEAFEEFFPKKKERYKRAAEGWRIERDDVEGTRWAACVDQWDSDSRAEAQT